MGEGEECRHVWVAGMVYVDDEDVAEVARSRPVECEKCGQVPHVGHFSRLGGAWWCDTCNSPYCELA